MIGEPVGPGSEHTGSSHPACIACTEVPVCVLKCQVAGQHIALIFFALQATHIL